MTQDKAALTENEENRRTRIIAAIAGVALVVALAAAYFGGLVGGDETASPKYWGAHSGGMSR